MLDSLHLHKGFSIGPSHVNGLQNPKHNCTNSNESIRDSRPHLREAQLSAGGEKTLSLVQAVAERNPLGITKLSLPALKFGKWGSRVAFFPAARRIFKMILEIGRAESWLVTNLTEHCCSIADLVSMND